jgi:hypothetical protein
VATLSSESPERSSSVSARPRAAAAGWNRATATAAHGVVARCSSVETRASSRSSRCPDAFELRAVGLDVRAHIQHHAEQLAHEGRLLGVIVCGDGQRGRVRRHGGQTRRRIASKFENPTIKNFGPCRGRPTM